MQKITPTKITPNCNMYFNTTIKNTKNYDEQGVFKVIQLTIRKLTSIIML